VVEATTTVLEEVAAAIIPNSHSPQITRVLGSRLLALRIPTRPHEDVPLVMVVSMASAILGAETRMVPVAEADVGVVSAKPLLTSALFCKSATAAALSAALVSSKDPTVS
jgi:hypothetical protein